MPESIALIPARAGSLRVKSKNTRLLQGHPLIAYTIRLALESGLFNKVLVTTDSEETREIALHYGAQVPFLRPAELSSSISPDIEWIKHAFANLDESYEIFAILRPTSPFRTVSSVKKAIELFKQASTDSLRAVELCHEHPGKMWTTTEQGTLTPFVQQAHLDIPWHARQYQDLPSVYVQNSSLEIAWARVIHETNSREGKTIVPYFTEGYEGFSIDYEIDWMIAELLLDSGKTTLPVIKTRPIDHRQ